MRLGSGQLIFLQEVEHHVLRLLFLHLRLRLGLRLRYSDSLLWSRFLRHLFNNLVSGRSFFGGLLSLFDSGNFFFGGKRV